MMKVKQLPEDFRVEELTDVIPGLVGSFGFYRLDKVGWTTHDAVSLICRHWKLDPKRLSYGGLKDRHAETRQYLTIHNGPERNFEQNRIKLVHLGRTPEPFGSSLIRGNRFGLILRHLTKEQVDSALQALDHVRKFGVPNYFDDQRFGSVGRGGGYIAREMVHGRFEDALKLALVEPYEHDRGPAKREKAILRGSWGDWFKLKAELPRGHARNLVDYLLVHPADFKGAVARLHPELGTLYLSAYQSYLWNRQLDRYLRYLLPATSLKEIELKTGRSAVPTAINDVDLDEWKTLALPLLSARVKTSTPAIDALLADEGLTLDKLKIPGMERPYFSKGERSACLLPQAVTAEPGTDDLNAGRKLLRLNFELQRGSYATMIVKCVTSLLPLSETQPK